MVDDIKMCVAQILKRVRTHHALKKVMLARYDRGTTNAVLVYKPPAVGYAEASSETGQ